jgi:lipoate-protein ligase B
VLYPILDLKTIASPLHPRGLTARCYVHLLEETTIRTLKRYGVEGRRTENPGVWVDEDVKIAAVGVHARRNVVSYGVGLNVGTDLRWFERVVACGLVGKETTSIEAWRKREGRGEGRGEGKGEGVVDLGDVASVWGREFARGLWGEQQERVRDVNGEERRGLLEGLLEEGSDVYGEDIRWKDPEDVE